MRAAIVGLIMGGCGVVPQCGPTPPPVVRERPSQVMPIACDPQTPVVYVHEGETLMCDVLSWQRLDMIMGPGMSVDLEARCDTELIISQYGWTRNGVAGYVLCVGVDF